MLMLAGSGNYMTNFHEKEVECKYCVGKGEIDVCREDLREYVNNTKLTLLEAKFIVKYWLSHSTIPCKDCEGVGKWIERW